MSVCFLFYAVVDSVHLAPPLSRTPPSSGNRKLGQSRYDLETVPGGSEEVCPSVQFRSFCLPLTFCSVVV